MPHLINNMSTPLFRRRSTAGFFVLLCAAVFAFTTTEVHSAGYREMTTKGVTLSVWYPTDTTATMQRLGPFETTISKDAPVRAGRHQIILFSHGNSGRYRNHYLTAQQLADAGYIVITPQHTADYLVGSSKTAAALDYRYYELQLSLDNIRAHPDFVQHISPGPVHGVGYSLGGTTIMLAAGAEFNSENAAQHCKTNSQQDAAFCKKPGFLYRTIQFFRSDVKLRTTSDPFQHKPIVTGKAVLIAPVYQGLVLKDGLSLSKLTVIAINGDKIAQPRFHAAPLERAAKNYIPSSQLKAIDGHHYAFIAPFPKRVTDKEDIPVAKDPEGFDRSAFLAKTNDMILNAMGSP